MLATFDHRVSITSFVYLLLIFSLFPVQSCLLKSDDLEMWLGQISFHILIMVSSWKMSFGCIESIIGFRCRPRNPDPRVNGYCRKRGSPSFRHFLSMMQICSIFSGAEKFCLAHGLRQLIRDVESDVRI